MFSLCCSAALIEYIVRLWKSMHSQRDLLDFPRILVLSTLQILPGILGVHGSHDAIPLQLGIFLQGLAEQLVDCFQLGILMDIGLYELVDRTLELLQPNGFLGGLLSRRGCSKLPHRGFQACNSLSQLQRVISDLLPF